MAMNSCGQAGRVCINTGCAKAMRVWYCRNTENRPRGSVKGDFYTRNVKVLYKAMCFCLRNNHVLLPSLLVYSLSFSLYLSPP